MKNYQSDLTSSMDLTEKNSEQFHSVQYNQVELKCSQNNPAYQFCYNNNCSSSNPFTCLQFKCLCRKSHFKCQKGQTNYLIDKISNKVLTNAQVKKLQSQIQDKIQAFIDEVYSFKERLLDQISKNSKFYNLSQCQRDFWLQISNPSFFQSFDQNKELQFQKFQKINYSTTSKQLSKLWNIVNQDEEIQNNSQEKNKSNIQIFESQIYQCFDKCSKNVKQLGTSLQSLTTQNYLETEREIIQNSKILEEMSQINEISSFFPRKLKDLKILYRASENNFSMQKFYQKCGDKTNILIICKTLGKNGKIIGGYSTLSFQFTGYNQNILPRNQQEQNPRFPHWFQDPTKESFIFSLTQGDKFCLVNGKAAISRKISKQCIQFGNQFGLYDLQNIRKCCFHVNYNYLNRKYSKDKQSYLKLTGNQSQNFIPQEWEAWQVQFQSQK